MDIGCDIRRLEDTTLGGHDGEVYPALYIDKSVAVKVFKTATAQKEVALMKIMQESDNIVQYIGRFLDEEERPCVVMDFAYNSTVRDLLDSVPMRAFSDAFRKRIVYDICCGLNDLHKNGIAHEDLKPENVLLDFGLRAKLCDFGCARHDDDPYKCYPGGTASYLSPEKERASKVTGKDAVEYNGRKSDIYSLGKIIAEIFGGPTEISVRCMDPDPENRPNCDDLLEDFKPEWIDYTATFSGIAKDDLIESDKVNLFYKWSGFDSSSERDNGLIDIRQLLFEGEYQTGLEKLTELIDDEEPCSEVDILLGVVTLYGLGCEKNILAAKGHFERVREVSDEFSLERFLVDYCLAVIKMNEDEKEAVKELTVLASKGNSFALVELATLYSSIDFMKKYRIASADVEELLTRAAKTGYSHAQALLPISALRPVGPSAALVDPSIAALATSIGFDWKSDSVRSRPNSRHTFTAESLRYARKSAQGGSPLGQLVVDIVNRAVDPRACSNARVCEFAGDIYLLLGDWDAAELWYLAARSVYGMALTNCSRYIFAGEILKVSMVLSFSGILRETRPTQDQFFLKFNKERMLQAPYLHAAQGALCCTYHSKVEALVKSWKDESPHAAGCFVVFEEVWLRRGGRAGLIEEKKDEMSAEGLLTLAMEYRVRREEEAESECLARAASKGNAYAMRELADMLTATGDLQGARAWADMARHHGDMAVLTTLALIARKSGHEEDAHAYAEEGAMARIPGAMALLGILDQSEKWLKEAFYGGWLNAALDLALLYKKTNHHASFKFWFLKYFRLVHTKDINLLHNLHMPERDTLFFVTMYATVSSPSSGHLINECIHLCALQDRVERNTLYEWHQQAALDGDHIALLACRKYEEEEEEERLSLPSPDKPQM